jgi:hypothetical protein
MEDETVKGLVVSVYRSARWQREGVDYSNGGASSKFEEFTVIGLSRDGHMPMMPLPRYSQVFRPEPQAPAAVLVRSALVGGPPHLAPLDVFKSGRWSMDGGNLADSSDSRWGELVSSFLPSDGRCWSTVSTHDRVEQPRSRAPSEAARGAAGSGSLRCGVRFSPRHIVPKHEG